MLIIVGEKMLVDQTSIPAHLDQMVTILQEEERGAEKDTGTTGPCMEYLLQHKLLETLYSLGRTDVRLYSSGVHYKMDRTNVLMLCLNYSQIL